MTERVDLYEVLGIDRAADLKAIRAAYRKKSMTAHPDQGGDPQDFARVKLAHDVLTDPARRKLYDEKGSVEDIGAKLEVAVKEELTGAFEATTISAMNERAPLKSIQFVARMVKIIEEARKDYLAKVKTAEKLLTALEDMRGRFSCDGTNILGMIHEAKIGEAKVIVDMFKLKSEAANKAIIIARSHKFDAELALDGPHQGVPPGFMFKMRVG